MENLNLIVSKNLIKFRMAAGLTQLELAQKINYSDKSISKWENNSAIPDLEKIIKLSNIFEVSLDELVKGEGAPQRTVTMTAVPQERPKETGFLPRKIAGTILLCMAFLVVMLFLVAGGRLTGFIYALPFFTCGILCFVLKKNIGLWCA